jgi:integration host factor subunit beta
MSDKHISSGRTNKRRVPKYVPITAKNAAALLPRPASTLNSLTAEFDALLMGMQSPKARSSMKAAFNASPRELARTEPPITSAELIDEIARVTERPRKESEEIVKAIFESIIQALQEGDKIEIRGFGSFRTRERHGRTRRNRKNARKASTTPARVPCFEPSKELKESVNNILRSSVSETTPA